MKKITTLTEETLEQKEYVDSEEPSLVDTSDSRSNFVQEVVYQNMLEPTSDLRLFNLNYNNVYYGKIDNKSNFIIPKPSYIEEFGNFPESQFLLSFVRDAFEDFTRKWNNLTRKGALNSIAPIEIVPKITYQHYQTVYSEIMSKHYDNFIDFVNSKNIQKQIIDITSFLQTFSQYVEMVTPENPISLTKFVSSKYCSQHVSGLYIDTLGENVNNYDTKIEKYLKNSNFSVFVELAIQHGFIVDKNLPWRLVANLESDKMKKYIKKYTEVTNPYSFFFQKTETLDLILLKKHLLKFYNKFVDSYPSVTLNTTKICNQKIKIKNNKIDRILVNEFNINQILNKTPKEWWRLYCYIKISESNVQFTQTEFDKVVNLSFDHQMKFDKNKGMEYLARQIKMRSPQKNKVGGFRY